MSGATLPVDPSIEAVIQAIHDSPTMTSLVVSGGGSQAVAWLLGVAGASRTVLDVNIPYSTRAMIEYLGWTPKQAASDETAIGLAAAAYARGCSLREDSGPIIGVGCTAAIATDRPKRGDHRCHIAVWDGEIVTLQRLILIKGKRTRPEEELVVSQLVIRALADACEVETTFSPRLLNGEHLEFSRQEVGRPIERLLNGQIDSLTVYGPDAMVADERLHSAIMSGSYNPLHDGHLKLARVAERQLGMPLAFEISVNNVDKPSLTIDEIRRRLGQFWGQRRRVVLNRESLYAGKARLFPGSVFVTGYDTAIRLVDPAYYNDDPNQMLAALDTIRQHGCRFLIAGRLINNEFKTLADLPVPEGYRGLFEGIPEEAFRIDLSSTELRQRGWWEKD